MHEAMLWHKERNGVRCELCARGCFIPKGKRGFCNVRINKDNKLFTLTFGRLCSVNIDPIEKKPLFHFYPGSKALSIATLGCTFKCIFCFEPDTRIFTSKGIISLQNLFDSGIINEFAGGFVSFPTNHLTITHEGKISKITKVYKHFHKGKIIVIKPYYLPELKATPSHTFFALDRKDGKIKKIQAKDLDMNYLLLLPKFKFKLDGSSRRIDLKALLSTYMTQYRKRTKIDEQKAKEILELHKLGKTSREIGKLVNMSPAYLRKLINKLKREGITRNLFYEKNLLVEKKEKIKFKTEKNFIGRYIYLNEDLASLLGYYCAEGFVTKQKERVLSHRLVFSFGKHEIDLIEKVRNLIAKIFGLNAEVRPRKTTTTVELGKSSVGLMFKILCGSESHNKRVPEIILNCEDKRVVYSFLKAYFEGDGYKRKSTLIECSTSSEELAFGVYSLLLKLDLLPSFYKFLPPKKGIIEGRIVNLSPFFRVKIHSKKIANTFFHGFDLENPPKIKRYALQENEDYYLIKIRKISEKEYSGFVYNLEVEDDSHSYLPNFISACNCCNWQISQAVDATKEKLEGEDYEPEDIVELAEKNGCKVISYTYTEPTVFFEFAYKTAKLAHRSNIANTFVTNGYMSEEAVKKISRYLDAATVDFKASGDPDFYKKFMSVPRVEPIFDCLKQMKKQRIFIEITNLIVPKFGDSIEKCRKLAQWISSELGSEIPFHILQFFPNYQLLELPPTPVNILERCINEARETGLRYVYIGNVPGHADESTYCYNCRELLIKRSGFLIEKNNLVGDRCPTCGLRINIVV